MTTGARIGPGPLSTADNYPDSISGRADSTAVR